MPRTGPLRVGIVLRPHAVVAWHHLAVERMRAVEGVAITTVVAAEARSTPSTIEPHADPASRRMLLDKGLRDLPRAPLTKDVARRERLDVLIDFVGVDLPDEPPLGIWRYGFGDGRPFADGAAGTLVRLYRLTPDPDRAVILCEGWYRSRTPEAWGTCSVPARVAPWCARSLAQIRDGDEHELERSPASTLGCREIESPDGPLRRTVAVADTLREWVRRDRWTIGLVAKPIREILDRGALPQPVWLRDQPSDRFYADPFPIACDAHTVRVLVEDYRYRPKRKGLTELEIGRDGTLRRATDQDTLPRPASYPFLLWRDGVLVCVPETSGARAATTFARVGAKGEWLRQGDLVRGFPVVDPTLVEWNGAWWLFCTKQGDEDQTELYVFCAPSCEGPWEPHRLNPVKADTRSARPAGACFELGGVLYRPAQNCARRYGAGITINRVVELSPQRFREEPALALRPAEGSPWSDGLHTINSLNDVTIVDGLRVERRWS